MSQTYCPPAPPTSRVSNLLIAVWAILSLAAVGFVLLCGCNTPVADEWEFVAELVGNAPAGPWLWAQHNEHRLPLSKLLYIIQFRLTHDFRSGMLVQVGMLSALSLALMRYAARLRGRPHWADAFFPISLLHLGHWENFLLGYQICFTLFTVFVSGLIVVAVQATRRAAFRFGLMGGVLAILTALTGGFGLPLIFPISAWLLYLAVVLWTTQRKRRAVVLVLLSVATLSYVALYFIGYVPPPHHPLPSRDVIAVTQTTGEVLGMAFGIGFSGIWWLVLVVELALGAATIALLIRQAKNLDQRPSAVGLIAVAGGVAGVALAIGIGRASFGPGMGLWPRYALFMWPLLGAAYLAWVKAGRDVEPTGLARWVPIGLCVAAALAFPPNMASGLLAGAVIVAKDNALQADIRAGVPDAQLIDRHFPNSRNGGQENRARWAIPMLRDAGLSIFAAGGHSPVWMFGMLATVVVVILAARWLWQLGQAVQVERARELFRLQHERFEETVVTTASATGLPRGLRWVACRITGEALLVRDIATGAILALVPVEVRFEPIEGSDMEDVPAAREPRPATAVFGYDRGNWQTAGRVVFNHTPEQAAATFGNAVRVIPQGHH